MKTAAVIGLIVANVAVYFVEVGSGEAFELAYGLWPLQPALDGQVHFHLWQVVTYAFLHDPRTFSHLFFNMIGLFMFGSPIERSVGPLRLLTCYFTSVVTAAIAQLILPPLLGAPPAPALGASGGVFGLLLAYAILFPQAKVAFLLLPIPLPARVFAALYAGAELVFGVTGRMSGVAHFAHLGGLVGSALVVSYWIREARSRRGAGMRTNGRGG
jgi:membrane associated rhomboid family serine protease